jgi:minor extracellular protease Epr
LFLQYKNTQRDITAKRRGNFLKKTYIILNIVFSISLLFPIHQAFAFDAVKVQKLVLFEEEVDKDLVKLTGSTILEQYEHLPAAKLAIPLDKVNQFLVADTVTAIEDEQQAKAVGQVIDWSTSAVQAQKSWQAEYTGKNTKIAILDSGVSRHPDLKITGGKSFVSYTESFSDDNGHGTHVAGIIAALNNNIGTVGVAPDAELYAVKVLDSKGTGYLTDIISAIDWAITNRMDIINLSLGSLDHSPTLQYIMDKAYNSGILIVAAGGNAGNTEGTGDQVAYPAKYNSVIAVAAVDQHRNRGDFSATGSAIEFSAPGVAINSTYLNNGFAKLNGTSMAAGFVTGNLALLKEMYPTMTNSELRQQLKRTALDLGNPGRDPWFGFGLVQSPQSPERIAGKDRFEVAAGISQKGWKTANTVFISNNTAFADALSAAPLAYKKDAPLLLTGLATLHPITKNEINRLGATEVILVGGTGSISTNIEKELNNMGKKVRRIDGKNRFEVARNIALELGNYKTAIIANGLNFPDALAIAPYAAKNGFPILLTRPDYLPGPTQEVLRNNSIANTIVVGGEASVSNKVLKTLREPLRIGGKDRYEVALNIYSRFFSQSERLFLATGSTFADALTGSVLITKEESTILLTGKDSLPASVAAALAKKDNTSYVILGGTGSVGNGVITLLNK